MINLVDDSDHEWILTDNEVLILFDPLKNNVLSQLMVKIFGTVHPNLFDKVEPFVNKTLKVITTMFSEGKFFMKPFYIFDNFVGIF